ncbi:bleomycin resistance protein [Longimicrobium sp.]|uniref:bleomycin resistance protein n=1 Tax=Longimicrobium sp. TaxID=2029185 RepID=UPI003B3A3CD9
MAAIQQNHYVLAVPDVRLTADFFVRALGFEIVMEPPGWIFVGRDNCWIMLGECPDAIPPADLGDHSYFAYLRVDDADAFYAQVVAAGVRPHHPIEDKPWGLREFGVRTPDGHRIMIGHALAGRDAR